MRGTLGERVRQLRLERGETVMDAAKRIGISRATLSNIERGNKEPKPKTIGKLARGFDVPVEVLVGPASPEPEGTWSVVVPPVEVPHEMLGPGGVMGYIDDVLSGRVEASDRERQLVEVLKAVIDMHVEKEIREAMSASATKPAPALPVKDRKLQ
jgi:transcriptional regulator with XRE-family HTH domain